MYSDEQWNTKPVRGKRWILIACALGVMGAVTAIAMSFMTEGTSRKRNVVHQIAILRPPPPPPPKPEEKPPEPEIEEEVVKMPEPDVSPDPQPADAPPAGPDLGVDAQGTGDGDSFGLVGKPGGKDITTIGTGGGGGRAEFGFFAGLLQQHFTEQFNRNDKLKSREYKVVIKVWLGTDGGVQRYELSGSSGSEDTDAAILGALSQMAPMEESLPSDMPQPVRLRVISRGAG